MISNSLTQRYSLRITSHIPIALTIIKDTPTDTYWKTTRIHPLIYILNQQGYTHWNAFMVKSDTVIHPRCQQRYTHWFIAVVKKGCIDWNVEGERRPTNFKYIVFKINALKISFVAFITVIQSKYQIKSALGIPHWHFCDTNAVCDSRDTSNNFCHWSH